jgi:hypothetical protein
MNTESLITRWKGGAEGCHMKLIPDTCRKPLPALGLPTKEHERSSRRKDLAACEPDSNDIASEG